MRFKDKVVLVTGSATNTGLGIAKAFLREGAIVWINGRSKDRVNAVIADLEKELGCAGRAKCGACDVSDDPSVVALFDAIKKECGRLDILVNNAVDQAIGPEFLKTERSMLESALMVNVVGPYRCSQLAGAMMKEQGGGSIVNIGSNTSTRPIRNRSAYVTSKAAMNTLNMAMAMELGPYNIRVNMVTPGYIYTNRWDVLDDEVAERRRKNIPLGRESTAEDVAQNVMFVASDLAGNLTGANIVLDGGCSSQHLPADADG